MAEPAAVPAPLRLRRFGSFHAGGRLVTVSGQPLRTIQASPGNPPLTIDPNGHHIVDACYVQALLPDPPGPHLPLLLWHGGNLTGACYETTPDGREGWALWLVRNGWDVYVADAVERGRASWSPHSPAMAGAPVVLPLHDAFARFRIGDGPDGFDIAPARRRVHANTAFPVAAFDAFARQLVPRWTTSDAAVIAAYGDLVARVGPCAILAHSQAGLFARAVAAQCPDLVRALVLVEPSTFGADHPQALAAIAHIPVLSVWGDFITPGSRWAALRARCDATLATLRAAGGTADTLDLPAAGLVGNSHLPMMDQSSDAVIARIGEWLAGRGGLRRP